MKKPILALILAATMLLVSCSTSWLATFDQYVTLAAPAIVEVIEAIDNAEGIPVDPNIATKVENDAAALQQLGQSIVNATGKNMPDACAAFNVGLATFVSDVPSLITISQVSNPALVAEINGGIIVIQALITSIEIPIAACQSARDGREARKALETGLAKVQSPSDFVVQFNKFGLGKKLHIHSRFLRTITFGLEK
jgi:hypothetical protein